MEYNRFFSNVFVCFVLFQTEETDRKANCFIILIVVAVMASFINDYFANSDINLVVTIIFMRL